LRPARYGSRAHLAGGGDIVIRIAVENFDPFLLQPLRFGVLARLIAGKNNRVHIRRRDEKIILQGF
jgi:hypothetical protein